MDVERESHPGRHCVDGIVFQRTDGRWTAMVELPREPGGRRRRRAVYGSTLAEVLRRRRHIGRARTR